MAEDPSFIRLAPIKPLPLTLRWFLILLLQLSYMRGMFLSGDLVWGKVKFYPPWPAVVVAPELCGKVFSGPDKLWLYWLGDHTLSEVDRSQITPWQPNYLSNSKGSTKRRLFVKAMEEAHEIVEESYNFLLRNLKGCPEEEPEPFNRAYKNMPKVVADVLKSIVEPVQTTDAEKDYSGLDTGLSQMDVETLDNRNATVESTDVENNDNDMDTGLSQMVVETLDNRNATVESTDAENNKNDMDTGLLQMDVVALDNRKETAEITNAENDNSDMNYELPQMEDETVQTTDETLQSAVHPQRPADVENDDCNVDTDDPLSLSRQNFSGGTRTSENMCISCLKEDRTLIGPHPLFFGNICSECEKDVFRAYKQPAGRLNVYCIICGKKKNITHCCNILCLRAYCKLCLLAMVSFKDYDEIVEKRNWICFVCSGFEEEFCPLVNKRKNSASPPLPEPDIDTAPNEIVHILRDVSEGKKRLEDICISCCNPEQKAILPHPFFIGSICKECKKDVLEACSMIPGEMQDVCVICGQGGSLVYCSNYLCLRAYCKVCIHYMVSDKAYEEIVGNDKWLCYLCQEEQSATCLIKRRDNFSSFSPISKPANIFAPNKIGLQVLQACGIEVGNYTIYTDWDVSSESKLEAKYDDEFSFEQVRELAADLILGSFIPDKLDPQKIRVKKFAVVLERFLYKVETTKVWKNNVFFIFFVEQTVLPKSQINNVMQKLETSPLIYTFGRRNFYVWSNIYISTNRCVIYKTYSSLTNSEIENRILTTYVRRLKERESK